MKTALVLLCFAAVLVSAEIFFSEKFDDAAWQSRWVESNFKKAEGTAGKWEWTAGKYFLDENNKGIKTAVDNRFYQLTSVFDEFSNEGKDLVIQFNVKHEQSIDCGGGYIKLLPSPVDQENFNGDSEYNIMFGPDVCGTSRRVHVIFNYKGKNHLISDTIAPKTDTYTHVYTLIVKPDQTYSVLIDNESVASGSLLEDWDFLPPKKIKDPNQSKPADWVDLKEIDDPESVKPEGWDDIPELIVDPEATKPADWDEELDGEWEAPLIPNPEYKGEWEPKKIPNPDFKGPWVHPLIDNPEYALDEHIYAYKTAGIGFEIWQVKAGTIFDSILVTDDIALAKEWADEAIAINKAEVAAKRADDAAAAAAAEEAEDHVHDEL